MSNETQHTPADVRERLEELLDVLVTAAQRYGAAHGTDYVPCMEGVELGKARRAVVEFALLRTPRGEEEAWRAFLDALDEFEAAANLWADPEGPSAEDMARLDRARQRVIECARALATLRSEAQGDGWRIAEHHDRSESDGA